jgi:hypothetical protein
MNSKLAALALGLTIGVVVSQVIRQPRAEAQHAEKKMPWEYKTVHVGPVNTNFASVDPSVMLNQQGAAGWEFVAPVGVSDRPAGKYFSFLLKRPKEK